MDPSTPGLRADRLQSWTIHRPVRGRRAHTTGPMLRAQVQRNTPCVAGATDGVTHEARAARRDAARRIGGYAADLVVRGDRRRAHGCAGGRRRLDRLAPASRARFAERLLRAARRRARRPVRACTRGALRVRASVPGRNERPGDRVLDQRWHGSRHRRADRARRRPRAAAGAGAPDRGSCRQRADGVERRAALRLRRRVEPLRLARAACRSRPPGATRSPSAPSTRVRPSLPRGRSAGGSRRARGRARCYR